MQRRQIVVSDDVIDYLAELTHILFRNGYFDYFENALSYIDKFYDELTENIHYSKHIVVPKTHHSFGD